jgi:predicted nucleic acid-binding protein
MERSPREITVDTSAFLAVVLDEPERDRVVQLTAGCGLVAPGSVPWEVGNALSAMFKKKRLLLEEAREAISAFLEIPVRYAIPDLGQAVALADKLKIYAYDAYVLECAIRFRTPLVTLDRQVAASAATLGIACPEV